MARVNNELFHFLVSRNIFKGWHQTDRASEKTEQRRMERNRGRLVWISADYSLLSHAGTKMNRGRGTYERSKHGELKFSRHGRIN